MSTCKIAPPPEHGLKSSGLAVFLEFQSDDAANFQGFVITYSKHLTSSMINSVCADFVISFFLVKFIEKSTIPELIAS